MAEVMPNEPRRLQADYRKTDYDTKPRRRGEEGEKVMGEYMKARNANIYRVMETRPKGAAILLAQQYGISTQRVYQIYKEEKNARNKKKPFINSLDIRTRNGLLRAGFPANGTRDLLRDMIESEEWESTFRNVGVKTLEIISGVVGEKVKFELAYKRTEKIGRHEYTETIKRLVFDKNETE